MRTKSPSLNYRKKSINEKKNHLPRQSVETDSSLLNEMKNAKKDIDTILLNLNYQTDPDLIDCYTYQLKGAYMRYKFLLRKIQELSA